jgi:thioesterase domain-containing protein
MDQLSRHLLGSRPAENDLGEGRPLIDDGEMQKISAQALCWRPRPYSGRVLLFTAERHVRGYSRRPGTLGWDRYCSNLEVVSLPCDHVRAVFEPHVLRIAAAIDSALHAGALAHA